MAFDKRIHQSCAACCHMQFFVFVGVIGILNVTPESTLQVCLDKFTQMDGFRPLTSGSSKRAFDMQLRMDVFESVVDELPDQLRRLKVYVASPVQRTGSRHRAFACARGVRFLSTEHYLDHAGTLLHRSVDEVTRNEIYYTSRALDEAEIFITTARSRRTYQLDAVRKQRRHEHSDIHEAEDPCGEDSNN